MRAAIYARVSTDEQKEGRTIESQIKELERYTESHGHTLVERYIDEGWSGSLLSRPALDRLRDDAGTGRFDVAVVTDVDRLSRDVANLAVVKRDLEAKGIKLVFQRLPTDNSPLSDFMVNILGSFAEFERAMIRDRTRRGRRFKAQERQLVVGNLPPYGYTYVKKDRERGIEGRYEVNLEEAAVVRTIYFWVGNEGLSARAVVRKLRALGIPPRRGRHWGRSSVHRILTNETYVGTTYYNKHEFMVRYVAPGDSGRSGTHHPRRRLRDKAEWIAIRLPEELRLVPTDLFARVQTRLAMNRALCPRTTKYFYLLRHVRRTCARCGAAYVACPSHGRRFYRCSGRDSTDRMHCRAPLVNATHLERAVWQLVERTVQNPDLVTEQVRAWHDRRREEAARANAKTAEIEGAVAAVAEEEERVLTAYRHGAMTLRQFEKEIAAVNARRAALERLQADAQSAIPTTPDPKTVTRSVHHWSRVLRRRLSSLTDTEKQELLGLLLTEIRIDDDLVRVRGEIPACEPSGSGEVPSPIKGYGQRPARRRKLVPTPLGGHDPNAALPFEIVLDLRRLQSAF